MNKIAALFLFAALSASSQPLVFTNQITSTTNVAPLYLSSTQMDRLIAAVQAAGVSASFPINSTNLQSIQVSRHQSRTNYWFVVRIQVR